MQEWRSWEAASGAEWGLAVEREMVIRPLAQQERLSTAAIQDAIGPGRSVKAPNSVRVLSAVERLWSGI
jgi:hypothetical protein